MTRTVLAAFAVASLSVGSAAEQVPTPAAGCQVPSRAAHRSFSAKASTPIGGSTSDALAARRETKGSNSPKSSTPIGTATIPKERPRTAGAVTPKGSIPVPAFVGKSVVCAQ
jgi:hypothetical protein